jgi:protein-S-isoprenylcysteine O-methyltransferase Ste14
MSNEKTDTTKWKPARKDIIQSSIMGILAVSQIILCVLSYNWAGINILLYVGWMVLGVGVILCWLSASELRKKGEEEESHLATTVLVDSGVYAVIRHPMYFCWMLILLALMLISQHWLGLLLGVPIMASIYLDMRKEELQNIKKLGEDYRRYMQFVPRINFLAGIVRLLRYGRRR